MKKIIILGTLLALPISTFAKPTHYADVKITHLTPNQTDAQWLRAKQVTPKYPLELAKKGIAGCGVFKLTVNDAGKAEKIQMVSSIPQKGILRPAKTLIKSWQWNNVSGLADKAEEKLIRLDFCLGGNSLEEAQSRCAAQTALKCI